MFIMALLLCLDGSLGSPSSATSQCVQLCLHSEGVRFQAHGVHQPGMCVALHQGDIDYGVRRSCFVFSINTMYI